MANGISAPNGLNANGVFLDDSKLATHLEGARVGSAGEGKHETQQYMQGKKKTDDATDPALMRAAMEQAKAAEQGHGTPPTPAQLEFERKAKEREDIIKQNASIAESNRNLNAQIAKAETAKTHLSALANIWDISASFTRGELNDFTNSATLSAEIKDAARWLLSQSDADLAALGLQKGEGGVTKESINTALAALQAKIPELKAQIRPELPVPGEPVPPLVANQNPSSSTNSSTGTNGSGGTGNTSGPKETSAQVEARVFENYKKVGPFSSDATSAEGRLQDATGHVQKGIDALQNDLIAASTKEPPNQAEIMMIQNKMQQLQNALSALMQMMKQQQEMQSNMSKMFSEMASSAIRNMR